MKLSDISGEMDERLRLEINRLAMSVIQRVVKPKETAPDWEQMEFINTTSSLLSSLYVLNDAVGEIDV